MIKNNDVDPVRIDIKYVNELNQLDYLSLKKYDKNFSKSKPLSKIKPP